MFKTFYARNLRIFVIRKSAYPQWAFQPILMFVDEAKSLPK